MSELHQRLQPFQGTDGWVNKRKRCCAQYFLELLFANTSDTSSIFDAYTSWLIRMGRPWDICEKTLKEHLGHYVDQPITLRSSSPCLKDDYFYLGKADDYFYLGKAVQTTHTRILRHHPSAS